jgi:hypothetical protein
METNAIGLILIESLCKGAASRFPAFTNYLASRRWPRVQTLGTYWALRTEKTCPSKIIGFQLKGADHTASSLIGSNAPHSFQSPNFRGLRSRSLDLSALWQATERNQKEA